MPHECTSCGRVFPDGSKEMLSGCPDCGGNKFQFAPSNRASSGSGAGVDDGGNTTGAVERATDTVGRATDTVRDLVSSDSDRTDADSTGRHTDRPRTDDSTAADRTEPAPRPASDGERVESGSDDRTPAGDDQPGEIDASAFDEWPETARRPEDRSTPTPGSDSSEGGRDTTSTRESGTAVDRRESGTAADRRESTDDPAVEPSTVGSSRESPPDEAMVNDEDLAQADARSEVVSSDDLPGDVASSTRGREVDDAVPGDPAADVPPDHGRVVSEPTDDQPSIEELRAELNDQFESIKIVSPGQYELNLMELYNREEYIISLQEDGRYVIDVPDTWRSDEG